MIIFQDTISQVQGDGKLKSVLESLSHLQNSIVHTGRPSCTIGYRILNADHNAKKGGCPMRNSTRVDSFSMCS
jgi:hypothetical protein